MKPSNTTALVGSAERSAEQLSTPGTTSPAQRPATRTFAALRHRSFRLYAIGMLIGMAGAWMQIIAQGWLVYEISGSARTLGLVGFASAIPALLVSPWAGVVIDRVSKRNILIVTQVGAMACALLLATLTFTGIVQVWHIVLIAAALGTVNAVDNPARQAFVVEMVGREDLPNAIALNSMIFNSARIIGPAFGGLLLAAFGAAWCFLINGLSFLAVIGALVAMEVGSHARRVRMETPWTQLKDGITYVRRDRTVSAILFQSLIFSVFGVSYSTVLPAYVDRVLHVGPAAYGLLNAVAGVGAVSAALVIARNGDQMRRGWWLTVVALAFPVVLFAFAWSSKLAISLGLIYFMGIGFLSQFALLNTLLQTRVEDSMRGRVLSLYTLTFSGFAPFGNLAIGAVSESHGLSLALALSATVTLGLTALNLLRDNSVRDLR